MKVCAYCDTEMADDVKFCTACGGNRFRHQCANCGTLFDGGNFCPTCGVKIGQTEKICPVCRTAYYSPACPNCGFIPGKTEQKQTETVYRYVQTPVAPKKRRKKHIFGWILGWIFIFPLPLTVLIHRRKWNALVKLPIIAGAWLIYFLFIIFL